MLTIDKEKGIAILKADVFEDTFDKVMGDK